VPPIFTARHFWCRKHPFKIACVLSRKSAFFVKPIPHTSDDQPVRLREGSASASRLSKITFLPEEQLPLLLTTTARETGVALGAVRFKTGEPTCGNESSGWDSLLL